MGRKSRLKKERKMQQPGNVVIEDNVTGKEHIFSQEQIKIVAIMVAKAREEGQQKAAQEFIEWLDTLEEIKGIGKQRASAITNSFLAYEPPNSFLLPGGGK